MNWAFGDISFFSIDTWKISQQFIPYYLGKTKTIAVTVISEPFQVKIYITCSDCAFCLVSKSVKLCCSLSKYCNVVVCL